jgi:hypothetical protein
MLFMRGRLLKNFFCLFSEGGRGGSQEPYGSLKNEQPAKKIGSYLHRKMNSLAKLGICIFAGT